MTEPKFTQTPWEVKFSMCEDMTFASIETENHKTIAEVFLNDNEDEQEANAYLLKAAPKMYNVLNDILHDGFCADKFKAIHEVLCEARGESTESRCGSCKFFKSKISACVIRKGHPFYVKEDTIPCLAYEPNKESEAKNENN